MTTLTHDLSFALRTLAQRPVFTGVVVVTLALGIGAATVVFDLVNLLSWRQPAVERPAEVVEVYTESRFAFVGPYGMTPFPDYEDYRDASRTLTGLAAYMITYPVLDTGESTEPVEAWSVTGNFFDVLGVRAAFGRTLTAEDDRPGRPPAAVLGHGLWRKLGADVALVGQTLKLTGFAFTVVGVAPEAFHGTTSGARPDIYFPSRFIAEVEDPNTAWLTDRILQRWNLLGRLAPGVAPGQAEAEIEARAARLDREHPVPDLERRITVKSLTLGHPIDLRNLRPTLRLFGLAVGLLVLIVCANVANLQLSRAVARGREMGVRRSLGAGRRRLVRQLMTESLLLALAGGFGGLILAFWTRGLMGVFFGEDMAADMRFDHRVLGLTLAVSLVVTLLFGLVPAFATARVDLVTALKGVPAAGGRWRRLAAGPLLATAQIALSLVLLASSALLVRSLWQFRNADLGFETEDLLLAKVDVAHGRYSREEGRRMFRQIEERAAALPGVESAGLALLVPPVFLDVSERFHLPGDPETKHAARLNYVDAGHFATLGLPLLQGRLFEPRDAGYGGAGGERAQAVHGVVVINQTLAERIWPDGGALGRRIRLERPKPTDPGAEYEVIGVVGNVRQHRWSRDFEPLVYFTWEQRYRPSLDLELRAAGDPAAVFAALREELRRLDPGLAVTGTKTHDEHRWYVLVEQRLQTQTVVLFGLAGLGLALLGIFGVMSYAVSRQVREIGIRMAVGAGRSDVLVWVLGRGAVMAVCGVALGLAGSFWTQRFLTGMLAAGAEGADPEVLGLTTAVLLLMSIGAILLPARRAARLDPLVALRHE